MWVVDHVVKVMFSEVSFSLGFQRMLHSCLTQHWGWVNTWGLTGYFLSYLTSQSMPWIPSNHESLVVLGLNEWWLASTKESLPKAQEEGTRHHRTWLWKVDSVTSMTLYWSNWAIHKPKSKGGGFHKMWLFWHAVMREHPWQLFPFSPHWLTFFPYTKSTNPVRNHWRQYTYRNRLRLTSTVLPSHQDLVSMKWLQIIRCTFFQHKH